MGAHVRSVVQSTSIITQRLDRSEGVRSIEQLPAWFEDYNENHPHKGLKMMSPREYKKIMERIH